MLSVSQRLAIFLVLGVLLTAVWQPAAAQDDGGPRDGGRRSGGFGRGGFGGRGGFNRGGFGRGGGLMGTLRRDEVRDELKLSPEQIEKLEALGEKTMEQSRELFAGMRDASPEEREQLMENARTAGEKIREAAEAEVKTILNAEQIERLQQIEWQSQGPRALRDDDVAAKLGLSEDQREQITKLMDEADAARRESFGRGRRGGNREEREAQREELEKQLLAVLNADQTQQWTAMLGTPLAESDEPRERFGRGGGDRRERRESRNDAAPAEAQPADGDVVAELSTPVADEAAGGEASADSEQSDEQLLSFNFRFAPWELVLRRFAEEAELSLQMDVVPPGTLNYFDRGKYTPTQALDVLNGYLLQKGYLLVKRDRFLVVVNIDDGVPPNLVPQVTIEDLQSPEKVGKNQLVSIVMPLQGGDPATMAEEVGAMLGPQGKVVPMTNLSRLVVTDTGGNLRRIYRLLVGDSDGTPKSQKFRAFPLKYISAIDADKIVRDLFGLPARGAANNVSASSSSSRSSDNDRFSRFRSFRDRGRDDRGESRTPPAPATNTKGDIHLAVDERTNSLLVTAAPENLLIIQEALSTVDVGEGPGGVSVAGAGSNRPQLEVYEVQSADPREVTKTLDALLPGVVVNEDGRARRIHILATPDEHRQIRAIINQLDGASSGQGVTVVNLSRLDPLAAAGTLRSLFGDNQSDAPTIEPDIAGRRLLIRGSNEQLTQIKTLLAQMGEDGTGRSQGAASGNRGPIRTINLGGRDSEELIKLLEQVWGPSNKNPIRVVVPSAVSPSMRSGAREPEEEDSTSESSTRGGEKPIEVNPAVLRRDRAEAENDGDVDADESSDARRREEHRPHHGGIFATPVDDTNEYENDDAAGDEDQPELKKQGAPIVISPSGGNLIIASDDEEALNRMENLISALARAAPRKRQWTVFYLRSADAMETAGTLGELFPTGSVAAPTAAGDTSLMGSLSSLGGSLMDMSGLSTLGGGTESLRIIPEPRLNALFVSGPSTQIDEIENVLRILDGGELPESLRERLPRRIPLEHADVNEVAAIVREIYKDYMEEPNRGREGRGGGNPLAMMLGGGQQQAAAPGAGIKLTLGVDTRANTLIVSASNPLFEQIEAMVQSIDDAAAEAKQTVRVVQIDADSAPLIEKSLGSLFGKVKVSTTSGGGSTPPTAASNSTPSASSSDDDARRQQIREFFERRMRERIEGGNGSSGGRSGFGGFRDRGSRGGRSERGGGGGFSRDRGRRNR